MKTLNKGFTLIELLVVITIIGILATGATTVYTAQIQKARDTTRINDIKAIQAGVEQSYQDSSEYPKGSILQGELTKYMGRIPTDSKYAQPCNGSTDCAYAYITGPDNNGILYGEYEVSIAFENSGNKDKKGATDNGNDPLRLELGIDVAGNSTAVALNAITAATPVKGVTNLAGTTSSSGATAQDTIINLINEQ